MGKTKYTFDLANRLLTETNPLLKTTTFTYDAAGNRRTKLDANGHLTTYSYDDNRRLERVDFDDGTAYEYAFDTRGNRILEKGPSHERRLHFDALNRLDVVDDITFGKQLTYSYDANGNRTALTESGVEQRFEYDARNMLAAARVGTGPRTLFGHDALGRRAFVARPNGVRTDYAFDDSSQLLSMVHSKSGNVLLGFSYGYDGHGNRVSKTREDGTAEIYGYDSSMRLTQVDYGSSKTVAYGLDALGNRLNEVQTVRPPTGNSVITNFSGSFNAFNQLLTRNRSGGGLPALNTTFAYDDNGNTLSETTVSPAATTAYSWDRDNRLRAVTPPAPGVPTSYSYDASGVRVKRSDSSGTVNYLIDGEAVLAELDATNSVTTRFLNNTQQADDIVSFERGGATYYPLTDAVGSWYAVTDASGTVMNRFDFDVYGTRTDLGGSSPSIDVGYTGRWHDANGLVEHRDRQRRSNLGGWLSADRRRTAFAPNRYSYAESRPTMGSDPTGKVFSFISPGTTSLSASLADTAQLRNAVEDLLFSPTASRLVRAVHSSATVFRLQNQPLGYSPSGAKRFGRIGYPMDAHRDSCDGAVKVDVSIDFGAPEVYFNSLNGTQQAILGVSAAQAIFADLRVTVAHELMHALQYISATEKYDPFIFPDPDLTLLILQMNSEPVYVGPESPPKVESAISDQHLPNARLPADSAIYFELNE